MPDVSLQAMRDDFVSETQASVTRHKLRLILLTRRTWWKTTGNREAARKVTRELFDLAFKPKQLVETQQQQPR